MKVRILFILFLVACLGLTGLVQAAGARGSSGVGSPVQKIDPEQGLVEDLSTYIPAQMQAANVPGLSIALIQDGKIAWVEGFGEANSNHRETGDWGYHI